MAKQMSPSVAILGTHVVKPAGAQAHEGPLDMTAWDQVYGTVRNETVLLYSNSPTQLETLLGSLGRALAQFSPLAGRMKRAEKGLEIVCNGEGAEVEFAECEAEMSSFRGYEDLERVRLLVPEVDCERPLEEQPLLLVRVTRFRCGGVALGFSMAHMPVDGQAAFHFFSEWARLSRGDQVKEAPSLLYRTVLREREMHNNGGGRKLSFSDHIEFQDLPSIMSLADGVHEWNKETVKFTLPLTKAQLDALKKVASSHGNDDANSISFSRFEVVSAHIWRCLCKARQHEYEQETVLAFPIDIKRIRTISLPKATFGNMILRIRAKSRAGDLISNRLQFACGKLREAIDNVDEDYIWSNFDIFEKQDDLSIYHPS